MNNPIVNLLCLLCLLSFTSISSSTRSLLSPPWKHCVQRIFALPTRWFEIESDNYPNGITKQTQCSWIIQVNPSQKVLLSFINLNLTGSMGGCFTQYLEIYEVDTGQKLQRFCGNRRPGDYVSHGKTVRVDLLADTVAEPHEGFKMMVRATKRSSGFKKTFSFPAAKPKKKPGRKRPAKKGTGKSKLGGGAKGVRGGPPPSKAPGSEESPLPPLKNGGKVDLKLRQKLRNEAARNASKRLATGKPLRPQYNPYPLRPVVPSKSNNNKIVIKLADDENDDPELNLYLIIGVPAGGLLLLAIICIMIKKFVCDARKKHKFVDANQNATTQSPLQTYNHPIQRLHDLPGMMTSQPVAPQLMHPQQQQQQHPQQQQHQHPQQQQQMHYAGGNLPHPHPSSHSSGDAPPRRANNVTKSTLDVINDDVITSTNCGMQGTMMPVNGGYMFYSPGGGELTSQGKLMTLGRQGEVTSPFDDEGYGTSRTLGKRTRSGKSAKSKKKVPTLKRKLSEWEKQQIRRNSRKM